MTFEPKLPGLCNVLPNSQEEIASLVKLFNKNKITYTIRGNGQNLLGFAVNEGAIIDLNRMKTIEFDEKNWLVKVGPGVTAFDLQKQAQKRGYRINAAEPAALLCQYYVLGNNVDFFNYLWNKCRQLY